MSALRALFTKLKEVIVGTSNFITLKKDMLTFSMINYLVWKP
jgi:hypothetical protein